MNSTLPRHPMSQRGFTLLEILIVIAILGLLVGLGVASFGGIYEAKRIEIADLFVKQTMRSSLESYKLQQGSYPASLDALRTDPGGLRKSWGGPYVLDTAEWPPIDPWGEFYLYKVPGDHNKSSYDLWSKGPDLENGTEDDVGNWLKEAASSSSGQ